MVNGGRGRPPHPDLLTPAEWQVLDLVRHGMSRRQIAERRAVSRDGVRYHVRNIAAKLGVRGAAELRQWPGYPASSALGVSRRNGMQEATALGPIGQIALLTRSVERTEAFYRDTLGLPHLFTFGDLAFFDAHGTRLYFQRVADDDWRPGSIVYFRVGEILDAHAALVDRGVAFRGAPHMIHRHDDGVEEWMAFFDDPDGNTLALMSAVTPAESPAERSAVDR